MPYASTAELPAPVRNHLPEHAQHIYMEAFNNAHERYGEESRAARIAWAAVKKQYHKDESGRWVEGAAAA